MYSGNHVNEHSWNNISRKYEGWMCSKKHVNEHSIIAFKSELNIKYMQ